MSDYNHLTDEAVLRGLGDRISRFRLERNLTQADLATEAGVHKNTVFRLEAGESTQLKNLIRVLRVLGLLDRLESVVPELVQSPLRQLETLATQRKRAVSKADTDATKGKDGSGKDEPRDAPKGDWSWGDDDARGRARAPKRNADD